MSFLGLDLGGANVKWALVSDTRLEIGSEPLILLSRNKASALYNVLNSLIRKIQKADAVGIVSSFPVGSESLKAAFLEQTKALQQVLPGPNTFFIDLLRNVWKIGDLESAAITRLPYLVSSEIAGSVQVASSFLPRGLLVETGTASTKIVQFEGNRPIIMDVERLKTGEAAYLGIFGVSVEYLVDTIPYEGTMISVCPRVATMKDVFALTDPSITKRVSDDYGIKASHVDEAYSRIAVCAGVDADHIDRSQLDLIANYVKEKFLSAIMDQMFRFSSGISGDMKSMDIFLAGAGCPLLSPTMKMFYDNVLAADSLVPRPYFNFFGSIGAALVASEQLQGRPVEIRKLMERPT